MTAFKDMVMKDTAKYAKKIVFNEYAMYLNARYALGHGVFLLNVTKNEKLYVSFSNEYKMNERLKALKQNNERKISDEAFEVLKKEYKIFARECEANFLSRSGF